MPTNTDTESVKIGGAYVEDEDFVPDPTHQFGTLDTSGTAGAAHSDINEITPIFKVARAKELEVAEKALDPDDDSVPTSQVTLPKGAFVTHDDPEAAKERVLAAAKAVKKDPVVVGGPTPAQEEAEEKGDDKAAKAEAAQKKTSGAGGNA